MQKDTWLKVAAGIWILSALGGAIALSKGVDIAGVVETVGYLWILLAMLFGKRIAVHFPKKRRDRFWRGDHGDRIGHWLDLLLFDRTCRPYAYDNSRILEHGCRFENRQQSARTPLPEREVSIQDLIIAELGGVPIFIQSDENATQP
jgi:hypothetical protein